MQMRLSTVRPAAEGKDQAWQIHCEEMCISIVYKGCWCCVKTLLRVVVMLCLHSDWCSARKRRLRVTCHRQRQPHHDNSGALQRHAGKPPLNLCD
eukprot:4549779-Amphidinium_carterae.1